MADKDFAAFRARRQRENERILATGDLVTKRLLALDSATYRDGVLPKRTKELLGLVASMVLRCNDCIDYHLEQCVDVGWDRAELEEAMSVAMVVGGTIVIPHLRHAYASLADLEGERADGGESQ